MIELLRLVAFAVALLFLYANSLFVSRVSAGTLHDFGLGGGRQIKHVFVIVLENAFRVCGGAACPLIIAM